MTWTRIKATGYGKLSFRLSIDGFGFEPVTDIAMTQTVATDNDRVRDIGLMRTGLRDDWESVLERGTVKGSPMSVRIADPKQRWYTRFAQVPTVYSWLETDCATDATTVHIKSTNGFTTGDVVYAGSEAFVVGGKTATTLTGCTRGIWQSVAQKHYAGDFGNISYAEVTNRPRTLESRLARLYVYGEGDDLTATGTQVFLGIVSTEPKLVDPVNWEFSIDPVSRIFEQPFGADLGDEMRPRGVYRPHPFLFYMKRSTTANNPHGGGGSWGDEVHGSVAAGHYETQADFCEALRDTITGTVIPAMATAVAWSSPQVDVKDFDDGWEVWWESDGKWTNFQAYYRYLNGLLHNGADYLEGGFQVQRLVYATIDDEGGLEIASREVTAAVAAGGWYRAIPNSEGYGSRESRGGRGRGLRSRDPDYDGQRSFPRGYFGGETFTVTLPGNRIYVDTTDTLDASEFDWCYVYWPDTDHTEDYEILAVDDTARYLELKLRSPDEHHLYFKESLPVIRMTRKYAEGHVGDFVKGITDNAAQYANKGAVPWITTEVVAITGDGGWTAVCDEVCEGRPLLGQRRYHATQPVRFDKYLAEELKLANLMVVPDANGRMVPKRFITPTAQDPSLVTIDNDDIVLSNGMPTWEPSALGALHSVELSPFINLATGKHFKPAISMVDVRARSKNQLAQTLKVKPYSGYDGADGFLDTHPLSDLYGYFQPILRLLGGAYAIIHITTGLKFAESPGVGDGVLLSCNHLPDWQTGTMGVSNLPALVIGRQREWDKGLVHFKLLAVGEPVVGYTPSAGITKRVSGSGYGTYTFSVVLGDPLEHSSWEYPVPAAPTGENVADYFTAGDRVEVVRWNNGGATTYNGTIDSVLTSTSYTTGGRMRIDFDSDEAAPNFTIAGEYWVIQFNTANEDLQAAQELWGYVADEGFEINFSTGGTVPAKKYG